MFSADIQQSLFGWVSSDAHVFSIRPTPCLLDAKHSSTGSEIVIAGSTHSGVLIVLNV